MNSIQKKNLMILVNNNQIQKIQNRKKETIIKIIICKIWSLKVFRMKLNMKIK